MLIIGPINYIKRRKSCRTEYQQKAAAGKREWEP